jgi:hypothetical protein
LLICILNLPTTPQFYFSLLPNSQVHSTLGIAQMTLKPPTRFKTFGLSKGQFLFFLVMPKTFDPENQKT